MSRLYALPVLAGLLLSACADPAGTEVSFTDPSPSASVVSSASAGPTQAASPSPSATTAASPSASTLSPVPAASPTGGGTPVETQTPRELGQDENARIGVPYRYQLLTHCGIVATWWNGGWWNAAPPLSDGSGNPPPGWDNPYQDGVIVQVSETRLEFTGDQGQRADFVPRPKADGAPPECD